MDIYNAMLSGIFLVLGGIAFYSAALVSGHNIFRDFSFQLATFVTTVIGILLFLLSPTPYLMLFPSQFDIVNLAGVMQEGEKITKGALNHFHVTLIVHGAVPYLVSAASVGVLIGSLTAIQTRGSALAWIRKVTGLRFLIYSYGSLWDDVLSRVKRQGYISLLTENGDKITGELNSFSVKDENQVIALRNCKVLDKESKQSLLQFVLITEKADIKRIEIPDRSFNKHEDPVPHSSHSLYIALASTSMIIFSASILESAMFLKNRGFFALFYTYMVISGLVVVLAICLWGASYYIARQDFRRKKSYFTLCPCSEYIVAVPAAAILLFSWLEYTAMISKFHSLGLISLASFFSKYSSLQYLFPMLVALILAYIPLAHNKRNALLKEIRKIMFSKKNDKEFWENVVKDIYIETDLDKEPSKSFSGLLSKSADRSVFLSKNLSLLTNVFKEIDKFLAIQNSFLRWRNLSTHIGGTKQKKYKRYIEDEAFNVLMLLRWKI